jgi:hypothetical protein
LAIIALAQQRVTVYGASGKMMEGPVSTGATGHETPAGIYSILEKEEEHHSNLYDDASMPFMQRLTWTGISMHSGVLPGYPASHGCTRLSYDFAQKLYQVTKPGMRVVIVRETSFRRRSSNPNSLIAQHRRLRRPATRQPTCQAKRNYAHALRPLRKQSWRKRSRKKARVGSAVCGRK